MAVNAGVRPRSDASVFMRIEGEGFVDPRWRGQGLGTAGVRVDREAGQGDPRRAGPGGTGQGAAARAIPSNPDQVALIESRGFAAVNWSATMRVHLDDGRELPGADFPAGFSLRTYDESWSARTRDAHNAAFADHWGFVAWDAPMWQQWVDGSKNFRPAISWVVVDDAQPDVVVGYVQSNEFDAYEAMTGRREAYLGEDRCPPGVSRPRPGLRAASLRPTGLPRRRLRRELARRGHQQPDRRIRPVRASRL